MGTPLHTLPKWLHVSRRVGDSRNTGNTRVESFGLLGGSRCTPFAMNRGTGWLNAIERMTGVDWNGDGTIGGEGATVNSNTQDSDFAGLVKSRRRHLGQALGAAITARSFRTASTISVHSDLYAAVNEAITNISATILQGMEEPEWVFISCTNNHSLLEAMSAVREIWSKPCLHGVTTCQGLAANSGVTGTQQHETFSLGLFVICDESPYSLYDVVGVQCTDMAGFPKEVEEETKGFLEHTLGSQRHQNWKEMAGMWLTCTPTQEEPVMAAVEDGLGEYASVIPVCGGTASPNSMAFPFVDSSIGYAASMQPPHVFTGGTPADGGMVISILHTSCRVKPIFNNFFTPVPWAHGRAEVDETGTITKIGGRNATEVYREWLTRVEGRDPLPPNTAPDDFSMVPEVLVATAQRPIAIRLGYTSEHSSDFITCPPLNLSTDGLKVVLDLKHFMKGAKDPEDIEVYLMRVTDASLLRSLRRQQNHDVAGMLGVLCCTKMLDLKYSVMGTARLDEVNREICSSVRGAPFLVFFPLGEHGYLENRKASAHGKLMSSFMLFCRDTGQDIEDMVTLLMSSDESPAPEDPLQPALRVPWTTLTRSERRGASGKGEAVEISQSAGPEAVNLSSYHYYSLQALHQQQTKDAGDSILGALQPPLAGNTSYRHTRAGTGVAARPEGSFIGLGNTESKHHMIAHQDKQKEQERFQRRKRLCGQVVLTILSHSPNACELTKEMVEAFCDHLSSRCLRELVLSSRCCLRLCFLIEHRLLELAADKRCVRSREWKELSEEFGAIPWEVVEIGEKHFGLELMGDLLANDEKLWKHTFVTKCFQEFLTHPTCRQQVMTMWDGPRELSSSGYSAQAVHRLHMVSHLAFLCLLVPSVFSDNPAFALLLAAYRLAACVDDWHFTHRRYNWAYTLVGLLAVLAMVFRAALLLAAPDWTHIPNILIVILEGIAIFRFTINQEYLGTLQLAILRIGAEFYRFGVLATALIVIFAMALTVNSQNRDWATTTDQTGGEAGGRKSSEWFPGQTTDSSMVNFGQWLLELFLLVIFGADPRTALFLDAEDWGGWPRLLCMMILYCTFGAFSIVVLLNVLIAMCMSAYENVQQRREAEWQTLVFELARDYARRPFVPPGVGWLFKRMATQRAKWAWVRFVLPGGRGLLEEHKNRIELKQARAEARLPLFLDLVTSTMHEDGSRPKLASQAGLDSLRWQIENLQQVCCALQDQMDDESKSRSGLRALSLHSSPPSVGNMPLSNAPDPLTTAEIAAC